MTSVKSNNYGWVVVSAAFLITFITCGVNFSYGVFMLPIVNEMGWSRGLVSSVMLVAGGVYAITLLITGPLSERYGYKWVLGASTIFLGIGLLLSSHIHELWQLYVFNGLFIGLSIAASYAIPVALVALWFTRRQGLAVGVATLGVSLGTAFVPLVISALISSYGWRTTLVIAGIAVIAVSIPSVLLIRQPPSLLRQQEEQAEEDGTDSATTWVGLTLGEAVRRGRFWMLFFILLVFLTALSLTMLHLVPYAIDSGLSPVQAASLLTFVGIFGIAGRLISGVASDKYGVKPVMLCGLLLLTLITLMLAVRQQQWPFYIFAALFGLGYSSIATMMVRITRYVFGIKALGPIFSTLMIADGIGMGLGPWLAGYIFDITGGYYITFIAVAAALAVSAVLTVVIKPAMTANNP
jgi:MFS transporter, OFA family, oxalate/formate antiporter